MKLPCTLTIRDRSLSAGGNISKKPVKSTVAICKHPKAEKHYLLVFNGKNTNGTKYDLTENIQKVHTKFCNEGRITIQFKNPPHDIFINSTVILLKSFLGMLHSIVTGKAPPKDSKCLSLSVSVSKFVAPTKLVIRSRSEYPIKGFPPTLETLTIEGIGRSGLDLGILRLPNLKVLNLSDNQISKLPEEFSQMKNLRVLDISKNHFHKSTANDWRWLSGRLCETLVSLNLGYNKLSFLPAYIIKLKHLHSLDVSDNQLKEIPNGIGCLRSLKSLKLRNNIIEKLPGSIKCLRLVELDVSNNKFISFNQEASGNQQLNVNATAGTMKKLAAQSVLKFGLRYDASIIPATLVFYLDTEARYCTCGTPSFQVFSYKCVSLNLGLISESVVTTPESGLDVKVDCYFCSSKCARITNVKRIPLFR